MLRHDLMEFLLRVVNAKFIETSICVNYVDALEHLFNEILPRSEPHVKEWQEFRDRELWTLEVNDCLFANVLLLKKVYANFIVKPRKFMNYSDACRFMSSGTKPSTAEAAKKQGAQGLTSPDASAA